MLGNNCEEILEGLGHLGLVFNHKASRVLKSTLEFELRLFPSVCKPVLNLILRLCKARLLYKPAQLFCRLPETTVIS